MKEMITNYWPLILLGAWFSFRFFKTRQVKKRLPELLQKGAILIDVRSPAEFSGGHAPNSRNVPLPELAGIAKTFSKTTPVVVCCASGTRSAVAKSVLKKNGIEEVYNIGSWTNLMEVK